MTNSSSTTAFYEIWQGREDHEEGPKGNRWHQQVAPYQHVTGIAPVLIGYGCDAGALRNKGRVGAKSGPPALRKALAGLPALENVTLFDAGDINCTSNELEQAQTDYASAVAGILNDGNVPLGLGGDHSITYASFMGLLQSALAKPGLRFGIINFDAHLDNRSSTPRNSGTSFYDLKIHCAREKIDFAYACIGLSTYSNTRALIDRATSDNALLIYDNECDFTCLPDIASQLDAFVDARDLVYLTIDIDCLPASAMPAVSAPAAMGIDYRLLEKLATRLTANPKVVIVDIAEFNPLHDIDGHGAKLVGRLLAALISARVSALSSADAIF